MDLHHLKYFLVTAEEGSIHRASARLKVAQSALSRRILDLEAELDVPLFERPSGGLRLSHAGEIFIGYARRILAEVDAAAEHFHRLDRGQTDVLSIGLNGIAPQLSVVQSILRRFRSARPDVELNLVSLTSKEQLEAIREGRLDAGLVFTLPDKGDEFDHLTIASHRFVAVMPAYHPLAARDALKLADLVDEDFVLFTRSSAADLHDKLMANCRAGGLEPRIVQETDGEHTVVGLISAGMGMSFLNETISERRMRPDLAIKPVTDLTVEQTLDLIWLRANDSPVVGSLAAMAGSLVRSAPSAA